MIDDKNIIVCGGSGFIGSNICRKLLNKRNRIICIDNFYTSKKSNLKDLINHKNFKVINKDITKKINIKADEIYNFASPASPVHYQFDPLKTIKVNVIGSLNLLENAKKYNSKILQASTSEVYGDPLIHPQSEDYWGNVNPIGIRSCYDEGKRAAESIFYDFYRQYKTKIKIVRIFNTYGPYMQVNDGRVISNFVVNALQNKDINIYGNGKQTRSFCYITDLVDIILKIMKSKNSILGPFNIGNDKEYSMNEIADTVLKLCKSKSKIKFKKLPQDDPKKRKPDLKKVKNTFNWKAKVNLEDGLKETINYFKFKLNN